MYKLLAIDLDGTLLCSKKRISKENKEAIEAARKKGIKVVICSGRVFAGARMYANELGIKEPLIACNGAVIADLKNNKLLYSDSMRCEDYWRVVDICRKENIYFHSYVGDTMYAEKLEFSSKFYFERNKEVPEESRFDIRIVENARTVVTVDSPQATKIVAVSRDADMLERVRRQIEIIDSITVTSSARDNFEVLNQGVNKGEALKFLCDMLNINRQEVIAVGDNENDYSMLEFAGMGVAMGNSEDSIKQIADDITLNNNENGVSEVIKKYLL